ncbi:MAG: peptidoglycan-binding protein [Pseudomonadota bacterium]
MVLASPRFSNNETLIAASNNNPPLRRGSRGEGVRLVQQALIDLGYPMPASVRRYGSPDGIYGTETVTKVRAFQSDQSLGRDGIAGRNTMHKLDELLPGAAPPLPPLPAGTNVRIVHSVPMVRQGPNPICWIACAAMIMSFKQRRSVTVGEINNGFDTTNSSMGNPATTWPIFYQLLDDLGFRSIGPAMSPGTEYLVDVIRRHGPFILTHYTTTLAPSSTSVGTHAVVITGIDMNAGTCFFNNPWGTRNDTTTITTILGSMERLWNQNIRSVAYM